MKGYLDSRLSVSIRCNLPRDALVTDSTLIFRRNLFLAVSDVQFRYYRR